jgi:hypothetical protein
VLMQAEVWSGDGSDAKPIGKTLVCTHELPEPADLWQSRTHEVYRVLSVENVVVEGALPVIRMTVEHVNTVGVGRYGGEV